jgi:L-amino acid N-acyltransferase YncA
VPGVLRLAHADDAESLAAIYGPYVRDTAISFEVEPPTADEFRARLRTVLAHAPWLVCERDGAVVGYAYATRFHARAAYQWTIETTVYVQASDHRRGVGGALYAALLDALRAQGFRTAVGIIALPNPPSVALHDRFGFRRAGVLPAAGCKHGRWHDIGWWYLELADPGDTPEPPRPLAAVAGTPAWDGMLARAAARLR